MSLDRSFMELVRFITSRIFIVNRADACALFFNCSEDAIDEKCAPFVEVGGLVGFALRKELECAILRLNEMQTKSGYSYNILIMACEIVSRLKLRLLNEEEISPETQEQAINVIYERINSIYTEDIGL